MTKIMVLIAIVVTLLLQWASTNVCRYNFVLNKKTEQLNIISEEVKPTLGYTTTYYYKELNCNNVSFNLDLDRLSQNFKTFSVLIYQELTTDIKGDSNYWFLPSEAWTTDTTKEVIP